MCKSHFFPVFSPWRRCLQEVNARPCGAYSTEDDAFFGCSLKYVQRMVGELGRFINQKNDFFFLFFGFFHFGAVVYRMLTLVVTVLLEFLVPNRLVHISRLQDFWFRSYAYRNTSLILPYSYVYMFIYIIILARFQGR